MNKKTYYLNNKNLHVNSFGEESSYYLLNGHILQLNEYNTYVFRHFDREISYKPYKEIKKDKK